MKVRSYVGIGVMVAIGVALLATSQATQQETGRWTRPPQQAPEGNGDPRAFYEYAWGWFAYLNGPYPSAFDAARRWEMMTDPLTLFSTEPAAEALKREAAGRTTAKPLHFFSKKADGLEIIDAPALDLQAGSDWPLIDQLGNFTVNEQRINETMVQYIENPGGVFKCAQGSSCAGANLTTLDCLSCYVNGGNTVTFPWGAVEIKAAWRLFPHAWFDNEGQPANHQDVLERYHVRQAEIRLPVSEYFLSGDYSDQDLCSGSTDEVCLDFQAGLVGLHIVVKAHGHPAWVWSTFEQVDNYALGPNAPSGLTPTFRSSPFDPSVCQQSDQSSLCPNNRQPACLEADASKAGCAETVYPTDSSSTCAFAPLWLPSSGKPYYWRTTTPTAAYYQPPQIAPTCNEPAVPQEVNAQWQGMLQKVDPEGPWRYYQLVAVQWVRGAKVDNGTLIAGTTMPKNNSTDNVSIARNSVLESYLLFDQTLAAQVPGVNPFIGNDALLQQIQTDSQSTLADLVLASQAPPTKTGTAAYSSCLMCHQLASPSVSDDEQRIPTDFSFIFKTYLQN